jgi:hypothetical protein
MVELLALAWFVVDEASRPGFTLGNAFLRDEGTRQSGTGSSLSRQQVPLQGLSR